MLESFSLIALELLAENILFPKEKMSMLKRRLIMLAFMIIGLSVTAGCLNETKSYISDVGDTLFLESRKIEKAKREIIYDTHMTKISDNYMRQCKRKGICY